MQDVNVYIKTTARGPAKRKTVYFVYVIQMKTQQVLNLTKMHVVTYMDGTHEFTSWMEFELNRMKERNQ